MNNKKVMKSVWGLVILCGSLLSFSSTYADTRFSLYLMPGLNVPPQVQKVYQEIPIQASFFSSWQYNDAQDHKHNVNLSVNKPAWDNYGKVYKSSVVEQYQYSSTVSLPTVGITYVANNVITSKACRVTEAGFYPYSHERQVVVKVYGDPSGPDSANLYCDVAFMSDFIY